jgi:PBP1b-binding outer membrane lipoprotein LpoB
MKIMKTIKRIATISLLIVGCMVSYNVGKTVEHNQYTKDYQVATIMTTCCNNMVDNLGTEAEEIYYEYIDNLDCYSEITVTEEDIDNYNQWRWYDSEEI